jgi:hypothetical protein
MKELLISLFKDKKICLLGNGSSIYKYDINFRCYDEVIGFNRIHKTPYFNNITILCHGCGLVDKKNIDCIFSRATNMNNIKHLIFCPTRSTQKNNIISLAQKYCLDHKTTFSTKFIRNRKLYNSIGGKHPLTGIAMLYWIVKSLPVKIDIYGFDFYSQPSLENIKDYPNRTNRFHSIEKNKIFFEKLKLNNSDIITHFD